MELTEHIAQFLRDNDFDGATSGMMPPEPDRVATVYATGLRGRRDEDGSRFQIIVRGLPGIDTALADAIKIIDLLEDYQGITSVDSPYFSRIKLESGATALGTDANGRLSYSINFRAWYC